MLKISCDGRKPNLDVNPIGIIISTNLKLKENQSGRIYNMRRKENGREFWIKLSVSRNQLSQIFINFFYSA